MRVIKVNVRTPGLFLDRDVAGFTGKLIFQFMDNGTWKNYGELNPKIDVLPGNVFENSLVFSELPVSELVDENEEQLEAPTRDQGSQVFYLIVEDLKSYQFRVLALGCRACWDMYNEMEEPYMREKALEDGSVVVATGEIPISPYA